ncbi:hypothetical protein KM043_006103 [Ampulex compressa]|nr:hypothetical protein KM043_006103 [Ampulex compressa]
MGIRPDEKLRRNRSVSELPNLLRRHCAAKNDRRFPQGSALPRRAAGDARRYRLPRSKPSTCLGQVSTVRRAAFDASHATTFLVSGARTPKDPSFSHGPRFSSITAIFGNFVLQGETKMWSARASMLLILLGFAGCEVSDDDDASSAFLEVASSLFSNGDTINGIRNIANAFVHSDASQEANEAMSGRNAKVDGVGQIVSGIRSLFSGDQNPGGADFSMLGTFLESLVNDKADKRAPKVAQQNQRSEGAADLEGILNMGNMFLGQKGSSNLLMGLLPMILENLGAGGSEEESNAIDKGHDHSGHSWYMPPILEHMHVMWEHFSRSEFGQTLWKNSGLGNIVAQMTDERGRVQYEKILDSFENPTLRRRWLKSLTNYVSEWISHLSEPAIQQRYVSTAQFVGNSFLKSQGFPKAAMFDSSRPTESMSRLVNAVAKRHLGMKIDSSQYIKPAVAYIQELISLASEKGFVMSRINARELSNRLSDGINNNLMEPFLKAYRAYKWAIKSPQCASQILCTINEGSRTAESNVMPVRTGFLKLASYPAAWAVSNKLGINFWTLYGAITEQDGCMTKYPAECSAFHEEEIRVTTESAHSEL